jgi:anion-transporting  ArsA/GET3 family ATPase
MDVATFAESSKLKIVIGKGGVGKTAVSCALARAGAGAGLSVLILELEGRPEVARAFGLDGELAYDSLRVYDDPSGGSVEARRLLPDDALVEYLADHGMGRIARRLGSSGLLDVVAGAIPGIKDILILAKVKQLVNESEAQLILLDAPATGHAVTLLTSAGGMKEVAKGGPVRRQADEVVAMLSDPSRCQVTLVTLAEELPVTEAIEAAFLVEDRAGVALGPLVANRVVLDDPLLATSAEAAAKAAGLELSSDLAAALDDAAAFRHHRAERSAAALERLRRELPLEVLVLPELVAEDLGLEQIALLAGSLKTALEGLTA